MTIWLDAARILAGVNVVLLLGLASVWLTNYRDHGARHSLALLVFALFLLVENGLWVYFYLIRPDFVGWFVEAAVGIQIGLMLLCGLETVALAFVAWITLR